MRRPPAEPRGAGDRLLEEAEGCWLRPVPAAAAATGVGKSNSSETEGEEGVGGDWGANGFRGRVWGQGCPGLEAGYLAGWPSPCHGEGVRTELLASKRRCYIRMRKSNFHIPQAQDYLGATCGDLISEQCGVIRLRLSWWPVKGEENDSETSPDPLTPCDSSKRALLAGQAP